MMDALAQNLIEKDRWKYIADGLGVTLQITFFAVILGILLGFLVAVVRSTYEKTGKLKLFNLLCQIYLTVIRGTPVLVQLLIMYYIVFVSMTSKIMVASLAFGINSGAYVAEIIRAGILAVDKGQTEAGRSLGLSNFQTMCNIIIPQAFKNVLPPLVNEFIVLLKETAIVGYVGLSDLTRVANQIASKTYDFFTPMIGAAVIYFVIIKILTKLLERLERRMRRSDNR